MQRLLSAVLGALLLVGTLAGARAAGAAACVGDCNDDGVVTVDEILRGTSIALGSQSLDACPGLDADGSGAVEVDELITAVSFALVGCPIAPSPSPTPTATPTATRTATPLAAGTPIFPLSYRNTFVEVRSCVFSIEHGGVSMRILANPIGAQAYRTNANPMPVGSVVIKEEYNHSDCSDDSRLARWSVMVKKASGFDEHGDWQWQWVRRDRTILADGKASCIGCHLHPPCVARDYLCAEDDGAPVIDPFRTVFDGMAAALLAVTGLSATEVVVVGGDPRDGLGPYVLRYNGRCWRRLATGAQGALWWVTYEPIDGSLYMVGEGGLILRYDLETGAFERQDTPGDPVLFGVWGQRSDDIWAVGGDVGDENGGGVLWHFDGVAWTPVDLSAVLPGGVPTLFKIWGRSADEVYVVGQAGTILKFDGVRWQRLPSPTNRPLFSVHGNADVVIASGGFIDGALVEDEGLGFVDRTPRGVQQLNGAFVPQVGTPLAIGNNSALALRGRDDWHIGDTRLGTPRDFHAAWVDPEGGVWAVGGDLTVTLGMGVLAYGGTRGVSSEIIAPGAPPCEP